MINLGEFVTIASVSLLTAVGASHGLNRLRQTQDSRHGNRGHARQGEESGRPESGAWHEPRYGTRYPVDCRIDYTIGDQSFHGMLVDMSRQGWRARGTRDIAKGTSMTVQAHFPGVPQSILIDEAIVRWTDGTEFGMELTRINPEAAATLSRYLATHYPAPEPDSLYGLSPSLIAR
ncbi:MAG TPA: PilZ domain-containing protein [Nitrospira sp.]